MMRVETEMTLTGLDGRTLQNLGLAVGDHVRYMDPQPESRYGEFLGLGTVVKIGDLSSQRPIFIKFECCADGKIRKRTMSPRNLQKATLTSAMGSQNLR